MTGSRDLNHPGTKYSAALTSHSCKYQLAGHLVASAMDSYHLIEFKVKRGMIWDFFPPLGKKKTRKKFCAQSDIIQGSMVILVILFDFFLKSARN